MNSHSTVVLVTVLSLTQHQGMAEPGVNSSRSSVNDFAGIRPNILFVMADDLGRNDLGYSDSTVLSPFLDSLANDGIKLGSMYAYHWCAPSRTSFLTGRYVPRHGYESGGDGPDGNGNVTTSSLTYRLIPQYLRDDGGYQTIMAGKWHLGYATSAHLPENRGFDHYLGYLTGAEDYYTHVKTPVKACPTKDLWIGEAALGGRSGPANESKYFPMCSTFIFTEFLQAKISDAANNSRPVFVYASYQNVHSPLEVPKKYFDQYASQGAGSGNCASTDEKVQSFPCTSASGLRGGDCYCNRLVIKSMVTALDEAYGRENSCTEVGGGPTERKKYYVGDMQFETRWNTTVFVLMGDNGGPTFEGHSNSPLRGGKLNFFEGGIRPASFIHSPMLPRSARGTWYNSSAHETDWLATFLFLAGLPKPQGGNNVTIDGVNLWASVLNTSVAHRSEVLISDFILRVGEFKLVTGGDRQGWQSGFLRDCMLGTNGGWMIVPHKASNGTRSVCPLDTYTRHGEHSKQYLTCPQDATTGGTVVTAPVDVYLCSNPCTPEHPCLYNVELDPEERHDVASSNPTVVRSMAARLQQLQKIYVPSTTYTDNGQFCARAAARNGFLGPWL